MAVEQNPDDLNGEQWQHEELGWHVLSGRLLLSYLRRAYEGEDPDILFVELWVDALRERPR